jgi:Fe-S cluster assembly protein SufD
MNVETLSAIADKKIEMASGAIKEFRNRELELFKANGFNETTVDSYKFTNLESFFSNLNYEPHEPTGDSSLYKSSIPTITFIDGEFSASEELPTGITVKRVKDHFNDIKDLFREANTLSHLHHCLLNDGLIIEVSKNQEIQTPLRILHVISKSSVLAPTHVIIANPFSKVTVLEETRGESISHANVSETYLIAKESSHIEHIQIDRETSEGLNHGSVTAEVAQDATVKSFFFNATGRMNRKNLVLNLNAPGANGETYSLFLTNQNEHSDINTVINHFAHDTTSKQLAKGILDGESKGIFTGKIHIHPKAQRVASGQLNKNLLLSRKAQVHSQPQLEIFADDVKCSHGSTTGQLSDDEIFYFQARGIPADRARSILAHGFGLEVVQKISNKNAKDHISAIILENLETKFNIGRIS